MKKIPFILFIINALQFICCNKGLFKSPSRTSLKIITIEGVFFHRFISDKYSSGFSYQRPTIKLSAKKEYYFLRIDELRFLHTDCESDTITTLYNQFHHNSKKDIYDYPEYNDKNPENPQPHHFYGGDVYFTNYKADIAVAFMIKGKAAYFNSICKDYLKGENSWNKHCYPPVDRLKTPFISLLEIDTIYSLSEEQQVLYGLEGHPHDFFEIETCE